MTKQIGLLLICIVFVFCTNAQTIQGVIKDDLNTPIENALIVREDDPSIWTKSQPDGSFTIDGSTSNTFKLAALHFNTEKGYSFTSTTGNNVVLDEDELLSSDVYHISFDHLRPGDYYTKEELKDDFPVPSGAGFYEPGDEGSNRALVDVNESVDPGGQSLRVKFPAGQLKTANSGVDARIPLAKTYKDNDFDGEELYLSYWIKFSDNFEFDKCGGKLPSLGGSDLGLRENLWKGRIMWRNGGSIQFYMELPHAEDGFDSDAERFWGDKEFDGGDICTNKFTPYLGSPGWHNIELHYKLDDGTPIGLFEGWVDGDKGHKVISSDIFGFYRRTGEGLENLTTNAILLSTFLGGSSTDYEPTEDIYAWFDEFRVSRTRINEYEKYAEGTITSTENQRNEEVLSVFPNPSQSGMFRLSESASYAVYNAQGELVKTGESQSIDLSVFPKGVYLLKMDENTVKIIHQ